MKTILMKVAGVLTLGMFVAGTSLAAMNDPGIQRTQVNQERRINQGVRNGQLNPAEAGKLRNEQRHIKRQEARMAARHHGRLTRHDKAVLKHKQKKANHRIWRLKHNRR